MSDKCSETDWRRRLFVTTGTAALAGFAVSAKAEDIQHPIVQIDDATPETFIERAFEMRERASSTGDQPYGAIVVSPAQVIVGQAPSRVVTAGDPTAHAETEAIRDAARRLGTRDLSGHILYSSSRPCPMCEAAAYWANISTMIHGQDGRNAGQPKLCG